MKNILGCVFGVIIIAVSLSMSDASGILALIGAFIGLAVLLIFSARDSKVIH